MTPREPDRYEEKAKELCLTEWRSIAAALRQAADEALAQSIESIRALDLDHLGAFEGSREAARRAIIERLQQGEAWRHPCACEKHRALASPAAAPAAETCPEPPSRCAHGIPMDAPCMSCPTLAPGRRASAEGPVRAPPSEPAAPEKVEHECRCGQQIVGDDDDGEVIDGMRHTWSYCEPASAPTSEPAPLLPRVLAALEDHGAEYDGKCRSLAAELRAYIATAKGEGKT